MVGMVSHDQFIDHRTVLFLPLQNLFVLVFWNCFHSIDSSIDQVLMCIRIRQKAFYSPRFKTVHQTSLGGMVFQAARETRRWVSRTVFCRLASRKCFPVPFYFSRRRLCLHFWLAEKGLDEDPFSRSCSVLCVIWEISYLIAPPPAFVWNSTFIFGVLGDSS